MDRQSGQAVLVLQCNEGECGRECKFLCIFRECKPERKLHKFNRFRRPSSSSSLSASAKVHRRLSLHCGQTLPCWWWFNCSEGAPRSRDSPAGGGGRREGAGIVCLSLGQLQSVCWCSSSIYRRTWAIRGWNVNVGRVSKWSGVETCTFVLLCGVIVVQLLLVVAPQVTGVKIEICVLCMQKTSFVVVRWLHSSLVHNPVQQQ